MQCFQLKFKLINLYLHLGDGAWVGLNGICDSIRLSSCITCTASSKFNSIYNISSIASSLCAKLPTRTKSANLNGSIIVSLGVVCLFTLNTFFSMTELNNKPFLDLAIKQIAHLLPYTNKARKATLKWFKESTIKTSYYTHCFYFNRLTISEREEENDGKRKTSCAHQIKIQIEIGSIYPAARCPLFLRCHPPHPTLGASKLLKL